MFRWFIASIAAAIVVSSASAVYTVSVIPSTGPADNSPAYNAYVANAVAGIASTGLATTGAPAGTFGTPSYYAPALASAGGGAINFLAPNLGPHLPGVTGLWTGVATNDSAANFGAANQAPAANYVGQTGNQAYFGLKITKDAADPAITVAGLTFNGFNYPAAQALGYLGANELAGTYTNADLFGFFGLPAGGTLGTTPLVAITNINDPFDAIVYSGAGYGFQIGTADYTNLAELRGISGTTPSGPNALLTPAGSFTAGYTFSGVTTVGQLDINFAPAPATIALMGFGIAGLVRRGRRVA
jgi:hypothetical protein